MAKRHQDALLIQQGACNPSGIAHSIIEACRECRAEGGDPTEDFAIRLMGHQLAHVLRVREVDDSLLTYRDLVELCERKVAEQSTTV